MSEILQSINEQIISAVIALIHYLLAAGIFITGLVVLLVIYGNTLSTREDDELYLNRAEQVMMASEQQVLVRRIHRLVHVIFVFAAMAAILLLASAGLWLWILSTS